MGDAPHPRQANTGFMEDRTYGRCVWSPAVPSSLDTGDDPPWRIHPQSQQPGSGQKPETHTPSFQTRHLT